MVRSVKKVENRLRILEVSCSVFIFYTLIDPTATVIAMPEIIKTIAIRIKITSVKNYEII